MAVFKDTEFLYQSLGGFWKSLEEKEEFASAAKKAGLVIKFEISEPSAVIWITPQGIELGEQGLKADVTMSLNGDTCHAFWMKSLSLPVALAKRQIRAKGNIAKVMKLLPVVKPAFELYPDYIAQYDI